MITPVLISRIGWKTYLIFMVLSASFVPIVYFAYPETSGFSLEEIDNLFLPESHQIQAGARREEALEKGVSGKGDVAQQVEKV